MLNFSVLLSYKISSLEFKAIFMNCRHKIFLSQIRALTACLRKRKFALRIKALGLLNMQYKDVITYAKIR